MHWLKSVAILTYNCVPINNSISFNYWKRANSKKRKWDKEELVGFIIIYDKDMLVMNLKPSHNWGHNMAFGEEYYQNAVQLLRDIRGDAEILAEIATKATDALRTNHTVYANITTGHMPT